MTSETGRQIRQGMANVEVLNLTDGLALKVFSHKGLSVVIMLRDEHCPPHAHVDAGAWSARFKFSFWHNGVELWDVIPLSRRPPTGVLEGLRQSLRQPEHLRRARDLWWRRL